jgi:L-2-hydroxyglutarate oxidase LhgO
MADVNIAIIGAGVIGLACAEILSDKYDEIVVIEKNDSFGKETSSRNSEVIHAGMYYPENSLKAKLCVEGNKKLYEYCKKNNVEHKKCGKYIIAIDESDISKLNKIYSKGLKNNVEIYEKDKSEIENDEPIIKCSKGIYSPNTGIINSHELMLSFKNNAEKSCVDIAFNHEVFKINKEDDHYRLFIKDNDGFDFELTANIIINAAGLNADLVAESSGFDIDKLNYRQNYCRGHYFKLSPKYKDKIDHLIYPVPSNNYGIGIHITMDMNGYLKLGPDTEFLDHRNLDYSVNNDLANKFYEAGSSYIKDLMIEDISTDQSGIRPKLQKKGEGFRDFIISEESEKNMKNFINLIGIESPGLTCSISIAEYVSKIIEI